jgi:TonB family protein
MRTLQCIFLIAGVVLPSAAHDAKLAYVYCSARDKHVPTVVYSSPPISIPVGTLNCGDQVRVLGRKEDWVNIASTDGGRYVSIATLSRQKNRFVALDVPPLPEARPTTGKVLPQVISSPNPEYTQSARKAGVHGFIILKLTVGADGKAHDMSVVKGLGYGLDESAMKAVRLWKFEPALQDGVPVDFKAAVEVEFPPRVK